MGEGGQSCPGQEGALFEIPRRRFFLPVPIVAYPYKEHIARFLILVEYFSHELVSFAKVALYRVGHTHQPAVLTLTQ